ncbi:LuxR C-terminal-related transcriptional regulator [Streptomyces sp. NPDC051452]|uniref:LuxR family transcriptional regulator AbsR2 n=1 Tax=Streptomyces sp. NPDC051452 TaxID=3365654 RepID=UPI0037AFE8F0
MRTFRQHTKTLQPSWPFTGRQDELALVREALSTTRDGIVVTGPAGHGKTRLLTEAVRGADHTRVTGTPEARGLPFAAFAHLLPDTVSLHDAVRLLRSVRLLVVDDAHLLDEASAALVHQLAAHGRTRLLVAAVDEVPAPGAVARLWTGELLPRLALAPLPREDTARLLAAAGLEPLTAGRLHRVCRGDLRLLRDLVGALAADGRLTPVEGTDARAWRGPLPVTPAVRERLAPLLARSAPGERATLERLAFAEPLPLPMAGLDLGVLELLEADGLIEVDDRGAVTLAHPLHGPALRATTGHLRARGLAPAADAYGAALDAERRTLVERIERLDVRPVPTPVGEWLVAEGMPLPPGYAAVRARYARLRGEVRDAAAWAREGLRRSPDDPGCRFELRCAEGRSDEAVGTRGRAAGTGGDEVHVLYEAVRLGVPEPAAGRLPAGSVLARHAEALAHGDGTALDLAAEALQERGLLLFAAEAHAQAVRAHRDPRAARRSRTRALALAGRCQGARTPALAGLTLDELTSRQRQIVTLAAAGLSNREIAERLTLSVRTVGNHLYGAYTRLGTGDREALPRLVEQRVAGPA